MLLRSIVEELRNFDTALLANTIGHIDPTPPDQYYMGGSIQSVTPTLGPTVGVAVTCEVDTSTPEGQPDFDAFYSQLEEINRSKVASVWVVKTVGSRPDHECVLGDGMAKSLYAAGCIGVVTDGGVRDVNGLLTVPFSAYCRGKTIHHCAIRIRSINQPVEVGGITVRPDDIIHANTGGVIKIPSTCLDRLAPKAVQMCACEHDAHSILRHTDISPVEKQKRVHELFAKYGFTR